MKILLRYYFIICLTLWSSFEVSACSPCGALSNVTQNQVGTDLELTFTSNAGWNCCYTVQIEIVCANANFTGIANYFSQQLCHGGGANTNIPYPLTVIDLSNFCPGDYKWRAKEGSCNIYTPTFNFTVAGISPIVVNVNAVPDSICAGDNSQLSAVANGGCNAGVLNYSWSPAGGLNNPNIANPIATPVVTTTYTVTVTENGSCTAAQNADITVTVLPPSGVSAVMTDDICSAGMGTVTASPTAGIPNYTYFWPGLGGATTASVNGVFAGNYVVEMTDGNGCVSTTNVVVGDTPAASQGSTTLVSCPGGSDGTAFAEMIPVLGNLTYLWDDPAAQTTQTAVGLAAGPYNCTITSDIGCVLIVPVVVSEIPSMIGNIIAQTDVTCNSGNDGMLQVNVIQGTAPYTYTWDNSTSLADSASDLSAGPNICTVTDNNGCTTDIIGVLNEPPPLDITFITPATQICPEEDIILTAIGSGGSSPYIFTWFEDGTEIGTGDSIIVDPDVTNTPYCVVLSEECGSPTDEECTLIYFPTPIVPNATPDEFAKCAPNVFEFTNTSTNLAEIATTFWEFGDNPTHNITENGSDSTSHYYTLIGLHSITMTVTSIYGCVYSGTLIDLIELVPDPIADFNFTPNPVTILDTEVSLQSHSTSDVVEWYWDSPFSIPTTSTAINPIFNFPLGELGTYPITLIVITEKGCIDTVVRYLDVIEQYFYAPNSFTPDGDEFNQSWKIHLEGYDVHDFELLIFDRWGELIWENHDPSVGWDGTYNSKDVQSGTYVWRATLKNLYKDDNEVFNGTITLIK